MADVVLLSNRPAQVLDAIAVSQATMAKIRQNLSWAFAYNLVGVPVAAGALLPGFGIALTPSISGALMGLSSLAVMGNSLLLRRVATAPPQVAEAAGGGGGVGAGGGEALEVAQVAATAKR